MGGYFGAFAGGLANSLQQAQQRQTEQEYKKALVEHSKLQTKVLENKLQLADQEQGMMRAYLATKGIQLPAPQTPTQVAQAPPERQSLLGRIFNPNPDMPPVQTVSVSGQPQGQSVPQMIAQGQTQGQMPGQIQAQGQPNQAFMEDVMGKKMFDLPPWREKFEAEKQQIGRAITVMTPQGPAVMLVDKTGRPMQQGMFPVPPEYGQIQTKGLQGEEYTNFYNKNFPPGATGPVMTAPPPQMVPKGMPESVKEKVTQLETFSNQLQSLKAMGQNPKVFGAFANARGWAADTPIGSVIPTDPDILAFRKSMKRMENIQVHQFGGSNLTSQELQRALAGLPRAWNQQDFNTAVDSLIKGTQNDINDYYKSYAQSEAQRGVGQQRPSLNLQPTQAITPSQAEQELTRRGYKRNAQGQWVK